MDITLKELFKHESKTVSLFEIKNSRGFQVNILNLGGIITDIITPDRYGQYESIVLKYNTYETYIENPSYMGAIIGRFAGRICDGLVSLQGNNIKLYRNFGEHHGHGGNIGFNKKVWNTEYIIHDDYIDLIMQYTSPNGEEGYPGKLEIWVKYTVTNNNELIIEYKAEGSETTLVNLTNHSYFNLGGSSSDSILNHQLFVDANNYIELDKSMVPTGRVLSATETPFDFTSFKEIGKDINENDPQLLIANGYDHPWIINPTDGNGPQVTLYDPKSGRAMDVFTDTPCVVCYTLNYPDGELLSEAKAAKEREGICLECQNPPIGRNQAFVDASVLKAGESYGQKTRLAFYIK